MCNVPHRLLCLNTRALVGGVMLFGVVVEPLGCKAKLADIGHQRHVLRIIAWFVSNLTLCLLIGTSQVWWFGRK